MQLKRCPFSGSVLYMVGYCEDNKIPWIEWSRAALSVELQPTSKIIYPQATSTLPLTGDHFLPDTHSGVSTLRSRFNIFLLLSGPKNVCLCQSHKGGRQLEPDSLPLTLCRDRSIPHTAQTPQGNSSFPRAIRCHNLLRFSLMGEQKLSVRTLMDVSIKKKKKENP